MIDKVNEIFTGVATVVRAAFDGVKVVGEYTRTPSEFPCVTIDEISNTTVGKLIDNTHDDKFSGVVYRVQVFSNATAGKKTECRGIFNTVDAEMLKLGFRRVTYSTTPEIYSSTIYSITATYEGIISADNYIYRR